jgi:ABC-type uncharacterized transport system fused permease/ATPase subunit
MLNPFALLQLPGRHPLCPWRLEQHIDYYSSVDHIGAAIKHFETAINSWNTSATGNAVFVSGDDGCGKSSLIHRCVHALR